MTPWCEMEAGCDGCSGPVIGGSNAAGGLRDKGKQVDEENEVFMEAVDVETDQVQFLGSRKRGRSEGKESAEQCFSVKNID